MEQEIKNNTINNKCSKCGQCCGIFIPFTDKELKTISKYVKDNSIKPENRLTKEGFEARCCFYDVKNKCCKIYEVRPYVCKHFICNDRDWLRHRDSYERRTPYNSTLRPDAILATFDDKIYGNYEPLIRILWTLSKGESNSFKQAIIRFHRTDLLNMMECFDENGNKINM